MPCMSAGIIGRDEELAAIEAFLADVDQGPRALVLAGEAGIGKTVLWEAGVEQAKERFGRVLTCHGIEAEASFAFAGLSELLAGVVREVAPGLVPPRRHALEVALQLAEPGDMAPDAHVIGLALLDAVQALAEHGPVLVALDDVQWLDPASASVLQVAFRRLRDEPVGLLATIRLGPDLESPVELERSFSERRLERISVGPLSLGAVHSLLEERLGLDLTRPELARVQEATAGNPFFALELGSRARTHEHPPDARPTPACSRELAGAARRPSRTPARGDARRAARGGSLGAPDRGARGGSAGRRERVLEALETAVREGAVELDDSRIRSPIPCSHRFATSGRPSGSAEQFTAPLPAWSAMSRSRPATWRSPPMALTPSPLPTSKRSRAGRSPGRSHDSCRPLMRSQRTHPRRTRTRSPEALLAARFHRLAGDERRGASALRGALGGGAARSRTRRVCSPSLPRRFRYALDTLIELLDEALEEAGDDDVRLDASSANEPGSAFPGRHPRWHSPDARAALEKAELGG